MQLFLNIVIDGLIFSSYLFIVAVGLTIIFGVMKILNVAHGGFYAWGAYLSAFFISQLAALGISMWWAFAAIIIATFIVGIGLGLILEQGLLRFLYLRDEVVIVLATYGAFLILEDILLLTFGVNPYFAFQPVALLGNVQIGGISRDWYSLSLIALASFIALTCWLGLKKTRWGRLLTAVIYNRELSENMGINVKRVYTITFILGATLGALGGAYLAPTLSVAGGLGTEIIVLSFAVVVIGGMGSIEGAILGATLVGLARACAVHFFPEIELFIIYVVMATILIFRPEGLFTPLTARKI